MHSDDGTSFGGFVMAVLVIAGVCLGYWIRDQGVVLNIQRDRAPVVNPVVQGK